MNSQSCVKDFSQQSFLLRNMPLAYIGIEDLHLLIIGIEIIILYTTIHDAKYCR